MLAALRFGSFRWLFAAQVASAFGNFAFTVAIAALLVEHGGDAGTIGTVLALAALGLVTFAVPAGVIADRFPRRIVCVSADLLRMSAVGVIAIVGGGAPTAVIGALAFIVGMGESLFEPAYRGLVPRVLPDERLQAGNALGALSSQLALFIGPAIAGVVIAGFGAVPALALSSVIFALSWIAMLRVRETVPVAAEEDGTTLLSEAAAGFTAIRDRPWIGILIGMAMIHLLLAIAPFEVLSPLIAEDDYGDVAIYGWMLAAMGTGAIVGAIFASRIQPRLPGIVGLLCLMPFCVLLVALAVAPSLPLLLAVLVFAGFGEATFEVLWTTALQRDVPDNLLSRVVSLDFLGSLALLPLGLALTGPAVEAFGRDEVLIFGAVVALATIFPPMLSSQVRRLSSK
jgi:DHA3 family tetracycline resistance protein-like MFS transporter